MNAKTRRRLMIFIMGSILAFILCYKLAISKTLQLRHQYKNLLEESEQLHYAPQQLAQIKLELEKISGIIETSSGLSNLRSVFISTTSKLCEEKKIRIVEIAPALVQDEKGYEIQTNKIIVEGGFHDLLQLVYELENLGETGRLVSVKFYLEHKKRTRKTSLHGDIIMQNIIKK